jgi:glycosyltransferase involved in cell wall biosynthesis
MKKTYIDITQLVHWSGRLTGIPRVMNELSLRYAKNDSVVFLVWDKAANTFFELDIEKSLSRRGESIFYKAQSNSEAKVVATTFLKKTGHRIKKRMPGLHNRIASIINYQVLHVQGEGVAFNEGDELFIFWGEWADEQFVDAVVQAHVDGISLAHIVYDMLPILTPQYSGHSTDAMNRYYRAVLPLCRLVLSISESTKQDLTMWLENNNLTVPYIETFRLGDDFALVEPVMPVLEEFQEKIVKGGSYLLCVGTVEARKNHTLLYYVYKLAQSRSVDLPPLVIVGRRGWHTDDIYDMMISDPEVKDKFIFMTNTSDEELSWLYRHCLFTVYPSFYEGWGLPIAESIAYGKPCLASDTSSMMEIAGSLIDYFSPLSTDECLASITRLLDPSYREQSEKRIKKYKITTWDDTYRRVISLEKKYV